MSQPNDSVNGHATSETITPPTEIAMPGLSSLEWQPVNVDILTCCRLRYRVSGCPANLR